MKLTILLPSLAYRRESSNINSRIITSPEWYKHAAGAGGLQIMLREWEIRDASDDGALVFSIKLKCAASSQLGPVRGQVSDGPG